MVWVRISIDRLTLCGPQWQQHEGPPGPSGLCDLHWPHSGAKTHRPKGIPASPEKQSTVQITVRFSANYGTQTTTPWFLSVHANHVTRKYAHLKDTDKKNSCQHILLDHFPKLTPTDAPIRAVLPCCSGSLQFTSAPWAKAAAMDTRSPWRAAW